MPTPHEQRYIDFYETFSRTEQGKRVLAVVNAELDAPSFDKDNPHHTSYLEGRRSVLLMLRALIEHGRIIVEHDGEIPNQQTQVEMGDIFDTPGSR
jgi:hypothetical protein